MNLFHAVFDTRFWGSSFDFVVFIGVVEIIRSLSAPNTDGIKLTIITGASRRDDSDDFDGVSFIEGYESPADYNYQRLHDILLPCSGLAPCVKSVSVLDEPQARQAANMLSDVAYPPGVDWFDPNPDALAGHYPQPARLYASAAIGDIRFLKNSAASLKSAEAYALRLTGTTSPVVITMRNHNFGADRSRDNYDIFTAVANALSQDVAVLVVPDTSDVPRGLVADVPVAYEAALNVHLRSALYEVAAANFIGNNGPASLLNMNKNTTYHQSGIASDCWPARAFASHWKMAKTILQRIGGDGSFISRLEANQRGPNFFASDAEHQVCDYNPISIEKAREFLAKVGAE